MDKEYETIGWDAITQESERVYPDQDNPKHYGTLISWGLVFMMVEIIGIL